MPISRRLRLWISGPISSSCRPRIGRAANHGSIASGGRHRKADVVNRCTGLRHAGIRNLAALVLCTVGLSGCFTSSILVTVHPDGSASVEQRAVIQPSAMLEFQKLASPGLAAGA